MTTILIGLGGTGSRIVDNICNKLENENQKIIGYCIDCDCNDLRKFSSKTKIISLCTSARMKDLLEMVPNAKEWFPKEPHLQERIFIDGSGQRREVGRSLYEYAKSRGMIDDMCKQVAHLVGTNYIGMVNIEVVTSLAGGLGSGIFVELVKDLKKYLFSNLPNPNVYIRGHFIMPDNYFVIPSMAVRDNMLRNAELAMRELGTNRMTLFNYDVNIYDTYETYSKTNYENLDMDYVEKAVMRYCSD